MNKNDSLFDLFEEKKVKLNTLVGGDPCDPTECYICTQTRFGSDDMICEDPPPLGGMVEITTAL